MSTFLEYAFPKLDLKEIDKILKDNGLDKTALQILDENKNVNYDNFKNIFNFQLLFFFYNYYLCEGTEQEIKDNMRLFLIVKVAFNKIDNIFYKLPMTFTFENNQYTLTKVDVLLDNDFKTSDNIDYILKTNLNENIPLDQAEDKLDDDSNYCMVKLCKYSKSLQKVIDHFKTDAMNNMTDIKRAFNISLSINLFMLNNTQVPTNISSEYYNLREKLKNNNIK